MNFKAQNHQLGSFLGGNFLENPHSYKLIFGAFYKFKLHPIYLIKFSMLGSKLIRKNNFFENPKKINSNFIEAYSSFEYNFFDIQKTKAGSPFLFLGVGVMFYKGNPLNKFLDFSYSIPFGLGYKFSFAPNWISNLEFSMRYLPIQDFETSFFNYKIRAKEKFQKKKQNYPKKESSNNLRFAKLRSKKWYAFSSISLSYTFGKSSCYCQ